VESYSYDGLKWLTITGDKVKLYAQFDNAALVDGRVRKISYSLDNSYMSFQAVLPHFWDFAELDPQFSMVLESQSPSSTNETALNLEIALPSAFGVVLLLIFLTIGFSRLRTYLRVKKSFKKVQFQQEPILPDL